METSPQQAAEGAAIVRVLADVLNRLVISNSALAIHDPGQITKFHALKAPGIGILPYLERIHKYASCSNECFILALIYIDRLIQRNNFLLTELNVHRVIITAILLAAKFFDDAYYNNAYYSKVGGVLVSEMNGLEVDFLFRINFSLHVAPEVFEKYKAELVAHSMQSVPQHIPTVSPQMPPIEESNGAPLAVYSNPQGLGAPMGITHHSSQHQPQQVTPSVNPQNVTSGGGSAGSLLSAAQALEQQAALVVVERQLLHHQQMLQRAHSLPPFTSQGGGRCAYSSNKAPPFSAPMVSTLPVSTEDQYLLAMGQQLLPLQTTMVHHHHGQAVGGSAYQIADNPFGSLVAGHY